MTMEKMPMMSAILFSWERARGKMFGDIAGHNYVEVHVFSGDRKGGDECLHVAL